MNLKNIHWEKNKKYPKRGQNVNLLDKITNLILCLINNGSDKENTGTRTLLYKQLTLFFLSFLIFWSLLQLTLFLISCDSFLWTTCSPPTITIFALESQPPTITIFALDSQPFYRWFRIIMVNIFLWFITYVYHLSNFFSPVSLIGASL